MATKLTAEESEKLAQECELLRAEREAAFEEACKAMVEAWDELVGEGGPTNDSGHKIEVVRLGRST